MEEHLRADRDEPGVEEGSHRRGVARGDLRPHRCSRRYPPQSRLDQPATRPGPASRCGEEFDRQLETADEPGSERDQALFVAEHLHVAPVTSSPSHAGVPFEVVARRQRAGPPIVARTATDEHGVV